MQFCIRRFLLLSAKTFKILIKSRIADVDTVGTPDRQSAFACQRSNRKGHGDAVIQKTVKNGETTIDILDPTVKPMVMHYNKDEGVFNPYMLEDYTEELASQHGVKDIIGDEFTLANLQAKFKEIMSMNVEPSTRTDLLDVSFDYELNMINSDGDIVDDIWSTSADEYLAQQGNSDGSDSSGDSSEDSEDSSYDDSSYDDSYDDSYYDEDY